MRNRGPALTRGVEAWPGEALSPMAVLRAGNGERTILELKMLNLLSVGQHCGYGVA